MPAPDLKAALLSAALVAAHAGLASAQDFTPGYTDSITIQHTGEAREDLLSVQRVLNRHGCHIVLDNTGILPNMFAVKAAGVSVALEMSPSEAGMAAKEVCSGAVTLASLG